jgi:cobalt-zinc-cadmium efflux system outer membrane protein
VKNIIAFCILSLFLQENLKAEENCSFDSWQALTQAVDKISPETSLMQEQKLALESSGQLLSLKPDATVSGQFYKGLDRIGDGEIEASYLMVWEKSQKRQARGEVISESIRLLEAQKNFARARSRVELILAIHNIKHIRQEIETLEETGETYRRLGKKLRALPILSPEQQLTLTVFQMADDESSTKIANLKGEKIVFQSTIDRLTACSNPKLGFDLKLTDKSSFPSADSIPVEEDVVLVNEKRVAAAQLNAAQLSAVTDISIGPILRVNRQDQDSEISAGLAISMPLQGDRLRYEKAEAVAQYRSKNAEVELKQKQLQNDKKRLLAQYVSARNELGKNLNLLELQKKHKSMESLFSSGRINASLIIEAHRQIIESLNARHALECQALESLWNLYLLSGKIFEVEPK